MLHTVHSGSLPDRALKTNSAHPSSLHPHIYASVAGKTTNSSTAYTTSPSYSASRDTEVVGHRKRNQRVLCSKCTQLQWKIVGGTPPSTASSPCGARFSGGEGGNKFTVECKKKNDKLLIEGRRAKNYDNSGTSPALLPSARSVAPSWRILMTQRASFFALRRRMI